MNINLILAKLVECDVMHISSFELEYFCEQMAINPNWMLGYEYMKMSE